MHKQRIILGSFAVLLGLSAGWWYVHLGYGGQEATLYATVLERDDLYVRFEMEAYDSIQKNYWMQPGQYDLPKLFLLSAQKVTGASTTLATSTRDATAQMLSVAFAAATSSEQKRDWAVQMLQVLLYNLIPNGRDQLLSKTQEVALRQEVSNINPQNDLYGDLGLSKGASAQDVKVAYQEKQAQLEASSSAQAKEELKRATYAHQVLSAPTSKTLYDQSQAEPTVFGHVIGQTLYLDVQQIAPTTLIELGAALESASSTPLRSMIIDLRGNIGGALDFARFFLGIFMGPNQYAFDLFHQSDYQAQRTPENIPKLTELNRFAHIVILTDNMSQSTAELTASVMKRYRLATVVGTRTRGWGSVESTYALSTALEASTTYALELVNSLTLGADQQPIEQNGVSPDIDISNADWQSQVRRALPADLSAAVIQMESRDPWKF